MKFDSIKKVIYKIKLDLYIYFNLPYIRLILFNIYLNNVYRM